MTTSSLLRHGSDHARVLIGELTAWMARKGFSSLDAFRGKLAIPAGPAGAAGDRAGYVRSLSAADRGERFW
jgi:dihydroorotate dehydrogenase (fumarate)